MEAASSGLVIDRAIEPGVQIFGWEVANAAALELGRGARQRAQMLTAPPKSHARRRPCRNRWRIGFLDVASPLPQTRPRDWSLTPPLSAETSAPFIYPQATANAVVNRFPMQISVEMPIGRSMGDYD